MQIWQQNSAAGAWQDEKSIDKYLWRITKKGFTENKRDD